jgi:hypothetical protein
MGAFVLVAGLVAIAGCAREDRWTLDGSRLAPLQSEKSVASANAVAAKGQGVDLVQADGSCAIRNRGNGMVEATIQVTPGQKNKPAELERTIKVMAPPDTEVRIGRTADDASGNTWSYRLLGTSRK